MNRILKRDPILSIFNNYLYDSQLPLNINYAYSGGSLLGLCLIIQIISGILLAMHYTPHIDLAFDSVEHIMRDVSLGWLIRYTHSNTASFFFIIVYFHISRGLIYGSYIGERGRVWNIGIIIFILMIATAFLGYCCPMGSMSLWGCTVITNLFSSIPFIGQDLVQFIWGGFSINNATLNRFFALHYLLPFLLVGLTFTHLISLHSVGSSNPLGVSSNRSLLQFNPYYTLKDIFGFIIFFIFLIIFIFFFPTFFLDSENFSPGDPLVTPELILPEFYLLPFYSILRSIPNKEFGIIAMFSSLISLFSFNFTHFGIISSTKFRPFSRFFLILFLFNFLLLGWTGGLPVELPYLYIGQFFTFFFFFLIFILIPFSSFFELFLILF